MRKDCEACGMPFEAKNSRARYCSDRCRQRAHRGQETPARRIFELTDEEREYIEIETIRQAQYAAQDLARAAQVAPAPRCLVYRQLAETILQGLKSIGA